MTSPFGGNPDAGGAEHLPEEYAEHDCPFGCGATVKQLPAHLRRCPRA